MEKKGIIYETNYFRVGASGENYYVFMFRDLESSRLFENIQEGHGKFDNVTWRHANNIVFYETNAPLTGIDGWRQIATTPLMLGCGPLRVGTAKFLSATKYQAEGFNGKPIDAEIIEIDDTRIRSDFSTVEDGKTYTWSVVTEWEKDKTDFPVKANPISEGKTRSEIYFHAISLSAEDLPASMFHPDNVPHNSLVVRATVFTQGTNMIAFDSRGERLQIEATVDNKPSKLKLFVIGTVVLVTSFLVAGFFVIGRRKSSKE